MPHVLYLALLPLLLFPRVVLATALQPLVAPQPLSATFPQPFDSSLSYNLSTACVSFLARFVVSPELGGTGVVGQPSADDGTLSGVCRPFGLLQETSGDWAQLSRNATLLNTALSDLCLSTTSSCSSFMSQTATQMQQKVNCASDLAAGNAVAQQALQGLKSYDLLQHVGCLTDPTTGAWCYVQAATSADDGYLYSLPGGSFLPAAFRPTCSACSQLVLDALIDDDATRGSAAVMNATARVRGGCGESFLTSAARADRMRRFVDDPGPASPGIALVVGCIIVGMFGR